VKKTIISLLALLILLPGCLKNKKSVKVGNKSVKISREIKKQNKGKASNLFLDDSSIDEFVFEEDTENPFDGGGTLADNLSIALVNSDENSFASKSTLNKKYYNFKTIFFGYDRFSIKEKQKKALNHNLSIVSKAVNQGKTLVIEGHSCKSAGSSVYNMFLSEKRAQSVARFFVDNGISIDKLKIVGRGNEMCIVPLGDKDQQAPNRRVEIYVLG
jgi:outer membrane protein OmpA-like peptidoglycan-associated protein